MTWLDSCSPQGVNQPFLMTSTVPSTKCLWLRARHVHRVRVYGKREKKVRNIRGMQGEGGKGEDICNINRSLSLTPHYWPGRTPGAACEINKRKPSDRSSPPLWFSGDHSVTFPQDKVVKKVTPPPLLHLCRPFL